MILLLDAAYADVLESQSAQASGIEQVLGIDDDGLFQEMLDPVEVEGAKFGPARAHHQRVGALGSGVGGFTIADGPVEPSLGFRNRNRIVGSHVRAF